MSMANFFNRLTGEIEIQNLDAMNLQINNIPFNGGSGGGGISSITSSDSSVTVLSQNSGASMNLTNAGSKWSTFNATSNVNLNNNSITNLNGISFDGNEVALYYNAPSLGISVAGGASGVVYDSEYNKPSLSDVLSVNSGNGLGNNITNVNSISCTSLLVNNNAVYSASNPPPQMITQKYKQQIVNSVSYTLPNYTNSGSDTYWKLYSFNTANYPNCSNFLVNITNIGFNIVTQNATGNISADMYLIDNATLNTITPQDLAKSKISYSLNTAWSDGTGALPNYTTNFQLFYSNSTSICPQNLSIVFQCNNLSNGYLIRNNIQCDITGSTEYINYLAGSI